MGGAPRAKGRGALFVFGLRVAARCFMMKAPIRFGGNTRCRFSISTPGTRALFLRRCQAACFPACTMAHACACGRSIPPFSKRRTFAMVTWSHIHGRMQPLGWTMSASLFPRPGAVISVNPWRRFFCPMEAARRTSPSFRTSFFLEKRRLQGFLLLIATAGTARHTVSRWRILPRACAYACFTPRFTKAT